MEGIASRFKAVLLAFALVVIVAPTGAVASAGSDQYCDPFGGCQVNGGGPAGGGGKKPGGPPTPGHARAPEPSDAGGVPAADLAKVPSGWQLQDSKEFLAALAEAKIARARTIRLAAARQVLDAAGLSPLRIWLPAG